MTFFKKYSWPQKLGLVLLDLIIVCFSLYLALILRYETSWNWEFTNTFLHLPEVLCVYLAVFLIGGLYDILWRYAGVSELMRVSLITLCAALITLIMNMLFRWSVSRPVLCLLAIVTVILIGGSRLGWRLFKAKSRANAASQQNVNSPRLMIVGAGMAGSYVLNMCRNDPGLGHPVLFVDDDPRKQRQRLQGVQVAGTVKDIPALAVKHGIQDIIIAIPSLRGDALNQVVQVCQQTNCRVRISSQIQSSDQACRENNIFVRELNITDFLSRDEVTLDKQGISEYLTDRTVLVTGGGGSIGSELCRQIMRFSPKKLIIFDIYENSAYELECELKQRYGADCPLLVLVGSVRDFNRLAEVFAQCKPDVVFHAAAHKHVPLMEDSPAEAIKNNVFGTLNVLTAASNSGVERFVLLSTDKAVNPTNVMGASKRITEMVIQQFSRKTHMKCMAVRFGNVLGSHGSVIPLFEKQIRAGGPVTVTHPDIIRYFMTIPEAAQLVLQAGAIATSGSIFVLDMGAPVRIKDLAEQLIRFYGYEPGVSMDIVYTGLRPGEKLYEELLTPEEKGDMQRTSHDQIMIAPPFLQDEAEFDRLLEELRTASEHNDSHLITVLRTVVPTYCGADNTLANHNKTHEEVPGK